MVVKYNILKQKTILVDKNPYKHADNVVKVCCSQCYFSWLRELTVL